MAPTMYAFLLQQIAAESYLDGDIATGFPVWQAAGGIRDDRLRFGSNNYSVDCVLAPVQRAWHEIARER